VAPPPSRRVYALVEAEKGGLFARTTAARAGPGSGHHALRQRAWYYRRSRWIEEPTCSGARRCRCSERGRREDLEEGQGIHHGDHHDLWIDPADTRRMISANDGGVDLTLDGGESWFSPRLPSAVLPRRRGQLAALRVSCALQDLGTGSGPSNSLSSDGINHGDWYDVGGGEAGHTASDPSDPSIVYAGEYSGSSRATTTGRARRAPSGLADNSPAMATRTGAIASSGRRPSWSRPTTQGRLSRRQRALPHERRRQSWTAISPTSPRTTSRSRSGPAAPSRGTTRASSTTHDLRRRGIAAHQRASSGSAATTASST